MQSKTFTDYDEFAGSVKDVDARMMFQNATQHSWTISQAWLPDVHLQLGRLGSGNIVEGRSLPNGLLLYVPLTKDCEYRANGTIYQAGSVVVLEPGSEFCVASTAEHDWCTIQVPTDLFADPGAASAPDTQNAGVWVSHDNVRAARQIRHRVRNVMANATQHPEFEGTLAAEHVATELSRIAAEVVGRQLRDRLQIATEGRPALPRDEIIRRCTTLLEARETESVRQDKLLAAARVSESTLRRAFREYFGIGPHRYLQLRQLHQVHRALKAAEPETGTVTNVLFAHGVSELGRFAKRYRALFGELPSETLGTGLS